MPPGKNTAALLETGYWVRLWHRITENAADMLMRVCAVVVLYLLLRAILNRTSRIILNGLVSRESSGTISEERLRRLRTLQGLAQSVVDYVLFFIFIVLLMQAVGFEIMPFITAAGVVGVAVGFGAQKLVKDVISGFFLIIDHVFMVGETVSIGTITGRVEEMGMRVTRILDSTGRVYMLANGDIGTVTNLSRHPVQDFIEVAVAASADLNQTVATIQGVGETIHKRDDHTLSSPPAVAGMTAFTAASVTIRISVASDPGHLAVEQMRVREAVRAALLAANIPLA
jgi:small conductance mechanosensitive channel